MDDQGFADDILDPHTGIERAERVLKDDLHVAPQPPHLTVTRRDQIAAFEHDLTRGRLNQSEHQAAECAFA
jgi:hypothetical protein